MPSIDSNSPTTSAKGAAYWRSLEEYAQTREFQEMVEREFPSMSPDVADETTRRQFLKVMGASLALAGLTGCRWPEEKILPFASRPEGWVPGVPQHYATAMELGGTARGLLVKSYDGRPIKIEGNPLHPESQGASDILSQAAILEMYDPDRSQSLKQYEGGDAYTRTWDEWAAALQSSMTGHRRDGGRGLAILHASTSSESFAMIKREWADTFPQARWVEYEPVSRDNERDGARLVYGEPYRVNYQLEEAQVIVTFDEDLLVAHPAAVKYAFDYAQGRIVRDKTMNRLYAIESNLSATGGVADTRVAVAPREVESLLEELAAELFLGRGLSAPLESSARAQLQEARAHAKHGPLVRQIAEDLTHHRGHGAVVAGARLSPRSHGLALLINEALGNVGSTVVFHPDPEPTRPSHVDALRQLTGAMDRGDVSTLLIFGGNPVYDAPSDFAFAEKLEKVAISVHLGVYENETSRACNWHLPQAHFLESWSDARAYDGTRSVVQPLIRALYGGKTPAEALAFLQGRAVDRGYDLVRESLDSALSGLDREQAWRTALHDGVLPGTAYPQVRPTLRTNLLGGSTPADVARHPGRRTSRCDLRRRSESV